eukprot:8565447-Prorocentrum_lima.AAC.1
MKACRTVHLAKAGWVEGAKRFGDTELCRREKAGLQRCVFGWVEISKRFDGTKLSRRIIAGLQ